MTHGAARLQPRGRRSSREEFERRARRRWRAWRARKFGTGAESERAVRRPVGLRLPDRAAPASCWAGACGGAGRARASVRAELAQRRAARRRGPARADPAHPRGGPARGRRARRGARPGGGGERAHPGGRAQLPPARPAARVLLADRARDGAALAGATGSSCSRCGRAAAWSRCCGSGAARATARSASALGSRIDLRIAAGGVHEEAGPAVAVVAGDAAAVVGRRPAAACRTPRGCAAAPRCRGPARSAAAPRRRAGAPRSRPRPSGRAARPAASTPNTPATSRPVPIRSESTSSWALAGVRGSASRAAIPHAARQPRADRPDQHQVAEGGDQRSPGSGRAPIAHRRQQVQQDAVEQRDRHERGPHPGSAQPPAHPGRPEALLAVHAAESSLGRDVRTLGRAARRDPLRGGVRRSSERLRERRAAGELPRPAARARAPARVHEGQAHRGRPTCRWARTGTALQGIDVCETDRGGRVTYHGPGQLVAYPIMAVERVADFVHTMERAMVAALADEGIAAERARRRSPASGPATARSARSACACATGVSMHGLAVNVDNDLQPFEWIVPCGIDHVRMTSVCARDRARAGSLPCFRKRMAYRFAEAFGRRQRLVSLAAAARARAGGRREHPLARPTRAARACSTWARCARSATASRRGSSARRRAGRATASCAG